MAPTYQLLIFVFVLKVVPLSSINCYLTCRFVVMVEILSAAAARCYHYNLYLPSPPPVFLSHFSSSHRKGFHDANCDLKKVSLSVDSKIQDNSGSRRGRGSLLLLMCRVVDVDVVGKIVDFSAARYRCHTTTPCPVGCQTSNVVEIAPRETLIL